jgi:type I restriction enzyme S subunit
VPIIFLRHVGEGKYLTHKPGFMDKKKWDEVFRPYSVYVGELLVTKLGEPPGTCTIYPRGIGPAMVTPDVIKMEVNEEQADPRYLMYFFNSRIAKEMMFGLAFGVTRLRIDLPMFKSLWVPIPPISEQREIVPTEAELAGKEGRHYEHASVLLARIKAERERAAAVSTNGTGHRSAKARNTRVRKK